MQRRVGGEELFLVKDSKTAEKVIETVMDKYSPGRSADQLHHKLTRRCPSEEADLKRGGEPETVMTADEDCGLCSGTERLR